MASPESDIADKLVTLISNVDGISVVSFDRVRSSVTDYYEHEIPAVQLYDIGQSIEHVRGRKLVDWALSCELIMKTIDTGAGYVEIDQKALWDKRREIERAIFNRPNLDMNEVVHCILRGNVTDLHLNLPYYIARIDFDVRYYDDLVATL